MRSLARLITSSVAIYAVALHAILLGLVPIAANGDSVAPVPAICHGVTPGDDSSGQPGFVPGHACEHCNVCSTAAPPEPALGPVADLLRAAAHLPDGTWEVNGINLPQAGIWTVRVTVPSDTGTPMVLDAPIGIAP